METLAWIGVGVLGLLFAIYAVIWLVGMLSDPIGRAFMTGLALLAIVVWGVLGGLYLIAKAV
jgi:hypothetical protein